MDYKEAGVNIDEGYRAVNKYREYSALTMNSAALNSIGSFAGMYSLKEFLNMEDPVLVSGTDGVGTKLDIAFKMKKYDTVGIDCVAMCVNDILCHGARPLFFLDYIACGKLDAAIAAELVKGVAIGCRESGAVLLGGETAEHPGIMPDELYDIAGFAIGIVERAQIIDGAAVREGDTLLGIASSGVHSNGFSLIRKIIPDLDEDFGGMPIGMAVLEPTRLYVRPVLSLMQKIKIHGMAHITGGGFYENVPRIFAYPPMADTHGVLSDAQNSTNSLSAVIKNGSWTIPPIFARIAAGSNDIHCTGPQAQKLGAELIAANNELKQQMFSTFNMGIGFVLAIDPADVPLAIEDLDNLGFPAFTIGQVEKTANKQAGLRFA